MVAVCAAVVLPVLTTVGASRGRERQRDIFQRQKKGLPGHNGDCVLGTAGVFPFRTAMAADRPKAGYVEVAPLPACPLFPPGAPLRGHVHHCSEILQACPLLSSCAYVALSRACKGIALVLL